MRWRPSFCLCAWTRCCRIYWAWAITFSASSILRMSWWYTQLALLLPWKGGDKGRGIGINDPVKGPGLKSFTQHWKNIELSLEEFKYVCQKQRVYLLELWFGKKLRTAFTRGLYLVCGTEYGTAAVTGWERAIYSPRPGSRSILQLLITSHTWTKV